MSEDLESKIQELEEVKSKLEESEEKYKAMVENANDVIFTMDLRGNLLSANKRSENLTGYTQKELLKMNVRQLLDRDSWKVVLKGIKEIIFTKTYNIDELQLRTKNGEIITIDARAALLKIGNKSYTIVGIVRDITERKKYEAVLQESEEKYRLVVENSNDIIFTADLKGNIKSISKKVEKVIGYSQEELRKMHFSKLMPKSFLPSFMLGFKRLLTNGSDSTSDVPFIGKDGKKIYAEMHTSILKKEGKFYLIVGVIRDITERKKYEEELNVKVGALERYNKISVGREHTMMELKERIKELEEKLAEKE